MNDFIIIISSDLFKLHKKWLIENSNSSFKWYAVDFNKKPSNYLKIIKKAHCIVSRFDLSEKEWENAGNLKLLQVPIAGYDKINLKRAKQKNVYVCNNGGANSVSVSEHVFLLMLALQRQFLFHIDAVTKGPWKNRKYENIELCGKTLGIIGLGKCGKELAKRAFYFKMKILYYDIKRASNTFEKKYGLKFSGFEKVMKKSDIVSFHVPLTSLTKKMINQESLKLMKPESILINTSRGEVHDEKQLYYALKNNVICGAALDVFEKEPLPRTSGLLKLKNVILTPHCAPSHEAMRKTIKLILHNIKKVEKMKRPKAMAVDFEKGN